MLDAGRWVPTIFVVFTMLIAPGCLAHEDDRGSGDDDDDTPVEFTCGPHTCGEDQYCEVLAPGTPPSCDDGWTMDPPCPSYCSELSKEEFFCEDSGVETICWCPSYACADLPDACDDCGCLLDHLESSYYDAACYCERDDQNALVGGCTGGEQV